ncbi:MAG TPA: 30S ribosomal protein S9 [Ignavibacteriales bacterium]|jgi:small subunit ribosomal protein S9|nr:30S ribosomal protein S9 [Ignavibacteriales bacterium]HEX3074438.1 30S ribosomal protein S9 [Ignavibacteriales bacterium]
MADKIYVGRRKTAVARVIMKNGSGKIMVNNQEIEKAVSLETHRDDIVIPFKVTDTLGKFDVSANVVGGGMTGQAQAIRLGIARALVELNPDYRKALKEIGLLTRDPRMVERKKYGQAKARKRFQFSKR